MKKSFSLREINQIKEESFYPLNEVKHPSTELKTITLDENYKNSILDFTHLFTSTMDDFSYSPLNLYSSCNLIARSEMASVVDSLTAPLSVINALIVALCLRNQDSLKQSIDTLDQLYDDYQVYGRDEMDPFDGEIEIFHQGSKV